MEKKRPEIPRPIKRQLRKEAGFGCCVCGHPFFQYHHIVLYSIKSEHNPSDMMILCPNCHNKATAGVFIEEAQRECKSNPFNVKQNKVSGQLEILPGSKNVFLGGNHFRTNGAL